MSGAAAHGTCGTGINLYLNGLQPVAVSEASFQGPKCLSRQMAVTDTNDTKLFQCSHRHAPIAVPRTHCPALCATNVTKKSKCFRFYYTQLGTTLRPKHGLLHRNDQMNEEELDSAMVTVTPSESVATHTSWFETRVTREISLSCGNCGMGSWVFVG